MTAGDGTYSQLVEMTQEKSHEPPPKRPAPTTQSGKPVADEPNEDLHTTPLHESELSLHGR